MRDLWWDFSPAIIAILIVVALIAGVILFGYGVVWWGSMGMTTPTLDDGVYHATVLSSSYTEGFMFDKGILNVCLNDGRTVRVENGYSLRLKRMYIESNAGDQLILTVRNRQVREYERVDNE